MTGSLLERSGPLAALRDATDGLRRGASGVVLVAGEAGIGKTSLLSVGLGPTEGVRLLRGGCDDLVAGNPLGPLREAGAELPELAAIVERGRSEEVLAAVTTLFADGPPTVLVVEDLHWADDATVDVLAYLARRIARLRLLLVVSYRDDEVGREHPAQRFLAAATGDRVRRLRLTPLSPAGVAALSTGTGWDSRLLHEITGGNPFYLTESLAAPAGGPVPRTVADAVLARLHRLPERTRRGVETISVWPGELDFPLAEDLLGADLATLVRAEELGVLRVSTEGISFRHELARLATEASLPALRRRSIQAAVTRALRARGEPDVSRLVHHAVLCGDVATVAEFAPGAGRRCAQAGAHRQALIFFAAALEHEDRLNPRSLAGVLDDYAWELYNAHRFVEAVDAARRAADLWRYLGEPAAEAAVLGRLSRHLFMTGQTDDAQACAARAVQLSSPADAGLRAANETALGALLALDVVGHGAIEALGRAERRAAGAGLTPMVALARNYQSVARANLTPDQRVALLRDSIADARSAGADEFEARGYTNLAEMLYRYGMYGPLLEESGGWIDFAQDRGFWSHALNLEVHLALARQRTGDPETGRLALAELAGRYEDPGMLAVYSLPAHGRWLARRGEPGAESLLRTVWAQARRQRLLIGVGYAGAALMEWAWLSDDVDTAAEVVAAWRAYADRPTAGPLWAEIRRYAQTLGIDAGAAPPSGSADPFDLGLAGEWRQAADRWRVIGDAYESARELLASEEVAATAAARGIFEDLGASAAARKARQQLVRLGVRSGRRGPGVPTRRNPAGLTDRQVDVARLLASGLTNPEIAGRLVLSVRTVDSHVSAVLAKLGTDNRRQVASVVQAWPPGPRIRVGAPLSR